VNCKAIQALMMSRRVEPEGKLPGGRSDQQPMCVVGLERVNHKRQGNCWIPSRQIKRQQGICQLPISFTVDGDLLKEGKMFLGRWLQHLQDAIDKRYKVAGADRVKSP
jgi:hypothetical protein